MFYLVKYTPSVVVHVQCINKAKLVRQIYSVSKNIDNGLYLVVNGILPYMVTT